MFRMLQRPACHDVCLVTSAQIRCPRRVAGRNLLYSTTDRYSDTSAAFQQKAGPNILQSNLLSGANRTKNLLEPYLCFLSIVG